MSLNTTGQISLGGTVLGQSIRKEISPSGTGSETTSLDDSAVRLLAEKPDPQSKIVMPPDFWAAANKYTVVIGSNVANLDVRSYAVSQGWDQSKALSIVIGSGFYVYSDTTSLPAMTIAGSFPNGVLIVNNGFIQGKGGNGASYGTGGSLNATAGGTAISLGANATITNNGYIGGGGGGGSRGTRGAGGGGAGAGLGGTANGLIAPIAAQSFGVDPAGGSGSGCVYNYNSQWGAPIVIPDLTCNTGAARGGGRKMPGTGGQTIYGALSYDVHVYSGGSQGGGAGNAGLVGTNGYPPVGNAVLYANYAGSGGGGWGAAGGGPVVYSDANGTYTSLNGSGGKAISLNGWAATLTVGSNSIYGAMS